MSAEEGIMEAALPRPGRWLVVMLDRACSKQEQLGNDVAFCRGITILKTKSAKSMRDDLHSIFTMHEHHVPLSSCRAFGCLL